MKHGLPLALVLAATWLLWSGHTEALILGLGAVSVVAVVLAAGRLRLLDEEGVPLAVMNARLPGYVLWLLVQLVLSNLDVVRRVWVALLGGASVAPRMVKVTPTQRTAVGRVLFANSVTLTPGTVSVRLYDGELLVHALHAGSADDLLGGEMDRRVTALERP